MDDSYKDFYIHFNSRIPSLGFIKLVQKLKPGYDPFQTSSMDLYVNDEKIFHHLIDCGYLKILKSLMINTRIEKDCVDVYKSEIGKDELDFISYILSNGHKESSVSIDIDNRKITITAMDSYIDVVISVFSEFHNEVTLTAQEFQQYAALTQQQGANFFLNPNASTAFSHFIQRWVFNSYSFPKNEQTGVIVT
ncbi:conserved hypothetical protein [Vibrio chagasii]|nr:conserved hypothetical protein [Vibrio chagasii]CAH7141841.1 conserved hypothetical protein [Vibrio chagasii]